MAQPLAFTNALVPAKSDTVPCVAVAGVAQPVQVKNGAIAGSLIVISVGGQTVTVNLAVAELLALRITHIKTGGTSTDFVVLY